MFTITPAAAVALKFSRERLTGPGGGVYRMLLHGEDRVKIVLGEPADGDEAIEFNGEAVVYVSGEARAALGDGRIDIESTSSGPRITVRTGYDGGLTANDA